MTYSPAATLLSAEPLSAQRSRASFKFMFAEERARLMRVVAQGEPVIRVGIVGCNFGHAVQLPAFWRDSRCEVVAPAEQTRCALPNQSPSPIGRN